jgi:hypothetical protein
MFNFRKRKSEIKKFLNMAFYMIFQYSNIEILLILKYTYSYTYIYRVELSVVFLDTSVNFRTTKLIYFKKIYNSPRAINTISATSCTTINIYEFCIHP